MKRFSLKITPLAVALLGVLPLLATPVQAANSVKETITKGDGTKTYTYTASDTEAGDHYANTGIYYNNSELSNNGVPVKVTINYDDPNLELSKIKDGKNGSYNSGALFTNIAGDGDKFTTPIDFALNIKHLKSVYSEGYNQISAVHIDTDAVYNSSGTQDTTNVIINTITAITGNEERTINAVNKGFNNIANGFATAFFLRSSVSGSHSLVFDAPNTTYKASFAATPDRLIDVRGIRAALYHVNNNLDLDFRSGTIDLHGEEEQIVTGIDVESTTIFANKNFPKEKTVPNTINVKFSGGTIKTNGGQDVHGISIKDSATTDNFVASTAHLTISGGEINLTASEDTEEIGGASSNIYTEETDPSLVGTFANTITQTGGEIKVDGSRLKDDPTKYSIAFGLHAAASKQSGIHTRIRQDGGSITITNTKDSVEYLSPGLSSITSNKAEIIQGVNGRVTLTGKNNAVVYATSDYDTILVDLAGYGQANTYGIYTKTLADKLSTINIRNTAKLFADTAVYNNEGNSNTLVERDATIGKAEQISKFALGEGNDNLTFQGTDLKYIGELDGGQDADVTTDFDTLVLNNYQDLDLKNRLKNWERVELNGGNYHLATNTSVGHGVSPTDNAKVGGLVVAANTTLHLNNDPATNNLVLDGDLYNQGVLDLRNSNHNNFTALTINNDYHGGGVLKVQSNLATDNSQRDTVTINGNVYGKTALEVSSLNPYGGDQTKDGIKLIALADSSTVEENGEAFSLVNKVEIGAYEYNTLSYKTEAGKKGFYLESKATGAATNKGHSTIKNKKGATIHLLRPAAAAYVLAQQINAQALTDVNAGLYQRSGEQRVGTNYLNQSWVRTLGVQTKVDVANLGSTNNHFGLQAGYDFRTSYKNNLTARSGVSASYSKVTTTLTDSNRKEVAISGQVDTNLGVLSLYHTVSFGDSYFDLVGGLHFLSTDYKVENGGQQKAFGANLSVEGGYNFDLGNHFFVEPQVQLSYQGTHYAGFKDAKVEVKGYTHHSLRSRAGFRLGYHDLTATNLWLHANLETELAKTAQLTIGANVESIDRAAKTIYDLGLNGQVALNPTTILYGSVQYKGAVGKSETLNSGAKVKVTKLSGFGAEAGLRFTW